MADYLHDMESIQRFADLNRTIIKEVLLDGMHLTEEDVLTTAHNYIDTERVLNWYLFY